MDINKRFIKIYFGAAIFVSIIIIIVFYSVDFEAIVDKAEEEVKEKVEEVKQEVKEKIDVKKEKIEEKIKEVEDRIKNKLKKIKING